MLANRVDSTLIVTTLSNKDYWEKELEYEGINPTVLSSTIGVPRAVKKLVVLTHYDVITAHVGDIKACKAVPPNNCALTYCGALQLPTGKQGGQACDPV